MIRPLALMCTAGLMAQAATSSAADPSNCQACNTGSAHASDWMPAGNIVYTNCDDSPGYCSLCASKGWPDKGWNPPAHYPINRDGIWYRNWQPKDWYGSPGGGFIANSPMTYQPTDTTQLGFSYAKVPTWQSIRMVPPTPCPDHFHARVCVPRPHAGRLPDGFPGGTPYQNGQFQSGGYGVPGSSNCPSRQQGHAFNGPMTQPYAAAAATSRPSVEQPPQPVQRVSHTKQAQRNQTLTSLFKKLFN